MSQLLMLGSKEISYSYISKYLVNTLELNEKFLPVLASIARPPRHREEKFDKWPRPQLKLSNLTLVTSVRSRG